MSYKITTRMKINKVTITGADDKINGIDLLKLQEQHPFVEWGILFSKSKEGQQRYPTHDWIKSVVKCGLPLSAHFCGWYSKEVLENGGYYLIDTLPDTFKRIQLNYNFKNSVGWDLSALLRFAEKNRGRSIILQYNKSNAEILNKFQKDIPPDNIHFLYDSSGGRGVEIQTIKKPIFNYYTGYSGGINNENIDSVCAVISGTNDESEVWIDLESGVRTNNEFDLMKVKKILDKCDLFIQR